MMGPFDLFSLIGWVVVAALVISFVFFMLGMLKRIEARIEALRLLFIVVVTMATFAGFFLFYRVFQPGRIGIYETQASYESSKSYFFEELGREMEMGLIKTLHDTAQLRKFVSRKKNSFRLESMSLEDLLGQYLLIVTTSEETQNQKKEKAEFVKSLLKQISEEEPFSILPEKEQFIAAELKKAIEDGQENVAQGRLMELTTSLGEKLKSLDRVVRRNLLWAILSTCAGICGIAVTVAIYFREKEHRQAEMKKKEDVGSGS